MTECVFYITPRGRRASVARSCTCGESHGVLTWPTAELALDSGEFPPSHVAEWITNPGVGPTSRILAKRHHALERATEAWENLKVS